MHQQIKQRYLSLITLIIAAFSTVAIAQENSLRAPEVLDLDDPFARGINRAADQASGGLSLPLPNGDLSGDAKTGAQLLGTANTKALSVNLYRVAALAVASGGAAGQIFEESNQDVGEGSRPELPFLRLGTFNSNAEARQTAINLKSLLEDYIGGHFILRRGPGAVDLDIGPLHSVKHAENYCELMLRYSNGIVQDCYAVLEYPGYEPLDTFSSTAMLRLSADAVRRVLEDNTIFDLSGSSQDLIRVKEGDQLGNTSHQIVKIIPRGVVLVADDGTIETLPLDYLPEADFTATAAAPAPAADGEQPTTELPQ